MTIQGKEGLINDGGFLHVHRVINMFFKPQQTKEIINFKLYVRFT